jgi:hypothetical protein
MDYRAEPFARIKQALVACLARFSIPGQADQWWIASGFAAEAQGRWFWVTADHVINGKHYGTVGLDSVTEPRLMPRGDKLSAGIPFRVEPECTIRLPILATQLQREPRLQQAPQVSFLADLDIALVELRPYYVDQLKACGVEPLRLNELFREHDPAFMSRVESAAKDGSLGFYFSGIPRSGLKLSQEEALEGITWATLPVWPHDLSQAGMVFKPLWERQHFRGSVRGMSGGPAFAIVNGRLFWLGVQESESRPDHADGFLRIAHAAYMFHVIDAMAQLANQMAA